MIGELKLTVQLQSSLRLMLGVLGGLPESALQDIESS